MVKRWIVLLFLGVFLISLVSASQFAYNYLDNQVTTSSINYSLVNVNNSQYLGGLPASSYLFNFSNNNLMNITNNGTFTTIIGTAGNYVRIGDAGMSKQGLSSEDDLVITDNLEVLNPSYLNGLTLTGTGGIAHMSLLIGGTNQGRWIAVDDDGWHFCPRDSEGTANNNMILTTYTNYNKDHDHDTLSTNPTLFIHSATNPDTNNTQWLSLTHDQTNGVINTGSGYLRVSSNSGDISIYADKNITATGFITRTSVFDKSDGSPFNYIKDSSYYLDSKNKIKHKNFYGYVNNIIATDYSKPVVTYYYEDGIKKELITYPYTKMEEGVELGSEVDVLRQAVYELNERVKYLEANCILK